MEGFKFIKKFLNKIPLVVKYTRDPTKPNNHMDREKSNDHKWCLFRHMLITIKNYLRILCDGLSSWKIGEDWDGLLWRIVLSNVNSGFS